MSCPSSLVWLQRVALGWLVIAASCADNSADDSRGESTEAGAGAAQNGAAGQDGAAMSGNTGSAVNPLGGASGSSGSSASSAGVSGASAGSSAAPAAGKGGSSGSAGKAGAAAASGSGATAGAAGASGPQGELYAEDFEDGDLTMPSWIDADPSLGGMWTVTADDGGKVLAQAASVSDWVIAVSGDYRWTDQVVEARVKITSEPGKAGIFARVRDTRNYYFLYLDGGSNIVLRKRVDNSSTDIQKVKIETVANTWYTLKLSVVGDALEGYVDGEMLVSGSDTGVATGGVGVGTADCTAQFDDVTVHN
jgi:hypothetical protein